MRMPYSRVKRSKSKANDHDKRKMSLEEKYKLGVGLETLPQQKLEQVRQLAKKRNCHLRQDGDVIVLDLDTLDTETLWVLDRFLHSFKKLARKRIRRRQAVVMGGNSTASIGGGVSEGNKLCSQFRTLLKVG
ncbi:unnamed protein product [Linum trigynum]|uniref:NET domain-containing protein n=2 Tax=Linum trigynum TaxID=586398 RepID=A0AAV2DDU2_9ROSI